MIESQNFFSRLSETEEDRRTEPLDSKIPKLSAEKLSLNELLFEADQLILEANGREANPTFSGAEVYKYLKSYPKGQQLTQDILDIIKKKTDTLEFFGLTR